MCVSLYIIETNLQNSDHGLFLAFLYLFWCYFGTFMVLHQPKKNIATFPAQLLSAQGRCRRALDRWPSGWPGRTPDAGGIVKHLGI